MWSKEYARTHRIPIPPRNLGTRNSPIRITWIIILEMSLLSMRRHLPSIHWIIIIGTKWISLGMQPCLPNFVIPLWRSLGRLKMHQILKIRRLFYWRIHRIKDTRRYLVKSTGNSHKILIKPCKRLWERLYNRMRPGFSLQIISEYWIQVSLEIGCWDFIGTLMIMRKIDD